MQEAQAGELAVKKGQKVDAPWLFPAVGLPTIHPRLEMMGEGFMESPPHLLCPRGGEWHPAMHALDVGWDPVAEEEADVDRVVGRVESNAHEDAAAPQNPHHDTGPRAAGGSDHTGRRARMESPPADLGEEGFYAVRDRRHRRFELLLRNVGIDRTIDGVDHHDVVEGGDV